MFKFKKQEEPDGKKIIYYSREYRYLKRNPFELVIILFLAVIPFEILLFQNFSRYTEKLSRYAVQLLEELFHVSADMGKNYVFSVDRPIYYVDIQGRNPNFTLCFIILLVTLGVLIITTQKFNKNKPFMVYLTLFFSVLLISDIYFIFKADDFPYSLSYYSNCYLAQEIIILGMIGIVLGFAIAILPSVVLLDLLSFWTIMIYGIIYGTVRYYIYVVFLYWATNLFMAPIYFMMGVFLDFINVMAIYAVFAKKVSETYNRGRGQNKWMWS